MKMIPVSVNSLDEDRIRSFVHTTVTNTPLSYSNIFEKNKISLVQDL